jgi:alpha-beta hydrolase superfamily lysophospholipase
VNSRRRLLFAVLVLTHVCFSGTDFRLPPVAANKIDLLPPGGAFAIGTKIYVWVDTSRHEKASADPAELRQVIVQLWYPAESQRGSNSPYVPQLNSYRAIWQESEIEVAKRTQTHSHLNAKPIAAAKFPIVLLSHGWEGTRSEYTSLCEDLASRGYAVFGVDHPYMGRIALPSGRVTEATEEQFHNRSEIMEYYGQDLQFAIDEITKLNRSGDDVFALRLDLSKIAAIGHSSGFSAASTACRHDRRIRACVNVDAPGFNWELLAGLHQPLLWIRLERAGPVPTKFLDTTTEAVYELQIKGANHGSVEDWDYLQAASSDERNVAAQRLTLIRNYIAAFLSKTLRHQNSALLRNSDTRSIKLTVYRARQ